MSYKMNNMNLLNNCQVTMEHHLEAENLLNKFTKFKIMTN